MVIDDAIAGGGGFRRSPADRRPPARSPFTAWRALTSMLTSAIRSRSASVTSIGSAGSRSRATAAPGDAWAAAADSRQSAATSAGARSNRIGREKSSTSFTMRFSRVTSSSMSATASRTAASPGSTLAQRMERRLDDHQRIADLVRDDRRQAAKRCQTLLLRHLALEPHDRVGQRVERGRQQPRVFVLPPAPAGGSRSCASSRRSPRPRASRR